MHLPGAWRAPQEPARLQERPLGGDGRRPHCGRSRDGQETRGDSPRRKLRRAGGVRPRATRPAAREAPRPRRHRQEAAKGQAAHAAGGHVSEKLS